MILAWVQSWNIYEKHMKLWSPPEFFHKNMSHEHFLSRDPHFVILAWVQSWNIFEKLMKLWSPPEFFHINMSHEQLPYMSSTLRCNGFCLWRMQWHYIFTIHLSKCHCHKHLSQIAINLSIGPKASEQQNLTGFVELISLVSVDDLCSHATSQRCGKVINVRETYFCETILADIRVSWVFQIYFNFVPMLESWWVDHMRD